ncbi:nucleotidyl transferase AbiEii/AbiGii toxin family protein [Leyella lascolaii]|uniref:nucleotidyl transferase AbiEii/AbiGii toxin family protein n=1 Tax=Leyella lascolaii TaxID=1776379 RepID=UPI00083A6F71|nr:nucleotidyl transferase AbiEii/AbiGii toxin family protein [Leyella lascolaii]
MIYERAIREWNETVPWKSPQMVEQDLVICRALVSIFSDEFLRANLAFRGGTALHKLYLSPQPRYSEDIDLVQINPGPIKPIMFRLGEVLDCLPNRSTAQKRHSNKMYFKFESEVLPVEQIRLKIEINCFEHFNVMGLNHVTFKMRNSWFSGETEIATYHLEELIGTKMRALYQRKKGRDLFDISCALAQGDLNIEKVLECYRRYMEFVVERAPSYKEFVLNMNGKMNDSEFITDVAPLLRPEIHFDPTEAYRSVYDNLIDRLPGKRD